MSFKFKQDRQNRVVFPKIEDTGKTFRGAIRQTWFSLAVDMKDEANREILRTPKGGRTYLVRRRRGARPRRHVASAPGETHANMFGDLRKSLSWKVSGAHTLEFGYGVTGSAPRYARYVEFGTSRMAERPSLDNAINATQRNAEQHFERFVAQRLGR
jgi:HK97 gp10 family phage protein